MNSALVNAANDIVIANNAIQIPLSEPFAVRVGRGRAIGECAVDDISSLFPRIYFCPSSLQFRNMLARHLFVQNLLRRSLHHKVAGGSLQTVLIRVMINNRMISTEIVPGRRRWNAPFERSSLPRVCGSLLSAKTAVDQVEKENKLRRSGSERGDGDEFVQGHQCG